MAFVRKKYFNGNAYLYLQESYRTQDGVSSRHVRYIGVADEYVDKQKIYEELGTTKDMNESGFLMANGDLLDFTGRGQATGYKRDKNNEIVAEKGDYLKGERNLDHRDIAKYVTIPKSKQKDEQNSSRYDYVEFFGKRTRAVRIAGVNGQLNVERFKKFSNPQKERLLRASNEYDEFYIDAPNVNKSKPMNRAEFRKYVRDN